VAQSGTPVEVWRRPASAFVARFLGFSNVLPLGGGELLVLPPDALRLATSGQPGTVRESAFRGSGFVVTVDLDAGHALEVPVAAHELPDVGARVRVHVDDALTTRVADE
jgi:thiamine transport system ATP-binding protein